MSPKAVAIVTTALFVGSLFWLMNVNRVNSSLEAGLQKEKLNSESLLSEKLLLEKDIQKMKDQLASLKGENLELDKLAKATAAKLNAQEAGYQRMKKENLSLAQIRKQRQELMALRDELQEELHALKSSYAELLTRNNELNSLVASLEEKNRIMSGDLNRAMFATVDQSQIQAVKRKAEKLTVKARRTKKLIANFEVPANLKNLGFRIIDSKGQVLDHQNGTITSSSSPSESNMMASSENGVTGNQLQKVQMVYTPDKKLVTGTYTIEILNENLYVGSVKVKLR